MNVDIEITLKDIDISRMRIVEKELGLYAAKEWHRLYKKYVPFQTGTLQNTVDIKPWEIKHNTPYAHYQYEGEVYGPKYPLMAGGAVVGFRSKGEQHPTGRKLHYTNPIASDHWDKKADPVELAISIAKYIVKM